MMGEFLTRKSKMNVNAGNVHTGVSASKKQSVFFFWGRAELAGGNFLGKWLGSRDEQNDEQRMNNTAAAAAKQMKKN